MTPPKVLIADSISQRGVDELTRDDTLQVKVKTGLNGRELVDLIPPFSALVVRSQTKVTAAILTAGRKLRVVGRAGVGVDNVDVEAATRRGVVVSSRIKELVRTAPHWATVDIRSVEIKAWLDPPLRPWRNSTRSKRASFGCISSFFTKTS